MRYLFILLLFPVLFSCTKRNDKSEALELKAKAVSLIEAKDFLAARETAQEALSVFEVENDSIEIAEALYLIARSSALAGDFESAVVHGERGSALCKISKNYSLEYKLNNTLSWAYFTLGRDFNENREHQKRQLFVVEQLDDDNAKALVYNNYGYDATVSGVLPLDESIRYMMFANNHYAKAENHKGRWYTLMNLTWQHRLKNELNKSEEFGRLSVEQARKDKDRHAIIEACTNLGETLLQQNKVSEATPFYEEARIQSIQQDDRDKYVFDVYHSRYLWKMGKQKEAVTAVKGAIEFLESSEIFYEMLGRSFLCEYSFQLGELAEVKRQLAFFKEPRANYFSIESKVNAQLVEARLLGVQDKTRAVEMLRDLQIEIAPFGAILLDEKIQETIQRLKE